MSSGSDGLYLSPLSDMSPATSDCLEPYFSGGLYFIFNNTTNTSVIKHTLVPNGWVGRWLGGVVVGGGGGGGRGARQRCIVPSGW